MKRGVNGDPNVAALLIILGRTGFTDEERRRVSDLTAEAFNWELFADLAVRHGIAALVWQNMTDLGLDHIPPTKMREKMEEVMMRTITRVTFIVSEADSIVSLLEKEGITVLLLKGMALEAQVYGERGLRQMSDIDLLVSVEDIFRARDILSANGYVSKPLKSPLYRSILLQMSNHLPDMQKTGASVDIHHALFGARAKELTRDAIRESYTITAYGREHNILPPQTAYLSMVKHLNKHLIKGEFQLRLFTDIFLLLKKHARDVFTSALMEKARMAGIEQEVTKNLVIMREIYGIKEAEIYIPEQHFSNETTYEFTDATLHPDNVPVYSRERLYRESISALPGLRSKLIFLCGDVCPSPGFMKRRYGCRTMAGCLLRYPLRLWKIVWFIKALARQERG